MKQDWPRIPPPATRERLLASAELGRQIAALLDTETSLPGITQGKPRPVYLDGPPNRGASFVAAGTG
ncbi:MAG TPA: hypothetical protein PKY50_05145 [Candidatus Competibacter sp.]|nr:hypothetical protein [Candidatus Competibacter sp.]